MPGVEELGKVAETPTALGDANYHAGGPCGHVKPCHLHQPGRAGCTGEGGDIPEP